MDLGGPRAAEYLRDGDEGVTTSIEADGMATPTLEERVAALEEEVASTYERPRSSTSIFDLEPRESEKPYFETNPHRVTPITYDIPPTAYEN